MQKSPAAAAPAPEFQYPPPPYPPHVRPPPPHPRWVVIPYPPPPPPPPPPAVVSPPPQLRQYVPRRRKPPPPAVSSAQGNGGQENRTIWVGDLHYWMDENYLHSCFGTFGEVLTIKVIRNRHTGQSEGYGFVEFHSHSAADRVLQSFSGLPMPNTDQPFRLNWASYSMGERRSEVVSDHSIFVGDLASDVNDEMLFDLFASNYSSVKGAKVIIDANTGRSRGYGFVRFGDDNDRTHAMTAMNGIYCSTRPIRIGPATPRKSAGDSGSCTPVHSESKSTNKTIYVGGLDPNVSEDELRKVFSQYGEVASVKIPVGKQCGFVQFIHRNNAEEALQAVNGLIIGKQAVRVSWGRSLASKQSRGDSNNPRNGMYLGSPFYGGYGYASPLASPHMYAAPAAYGSYPFYGNQQLVS